MLSIAAIALAAASAATSTPHMATSPWWEKITVTYDADGSQRSCAYETSFTDRSRQCEVEDAPASAADAGSGTPGVHTTITFERRFTPGARPELAKLEPGDTLLGGHVMSVAIDGSGVVRGCSVVAVSGDSTPAYDCDQVRAERFKASAGARAQESQTGFLTVLVYGREEQIA